MFSYGFSKWGGVYDTVIENGEIKKNEIEDFLGLLYSSFKAQAS
jgi:hypothetical protein